MNIEQSATAIKRSVDVDVREWFDKTYGNSYFSARVSVDGQLAFIMPFEYGYGDHSKWQALKGLFSQGYIDKSLESLSFMALIQSLGIDFYWHKESVKKRDMYKVNK